MNRLLKNNLLVFGLCGAMAAAYLFLFYMPRRQTIERLRSEIAEKRKYVLQAAQIGLTIEAARKDLDKAFAFNTRWNKIAPKVDDMPSMFAEMTETIRQADLTPTRFDPEPPNRLQKIAQIPVSIGLTGSYRDIYEVLNKLESMPQGLWIDGVKIAASTKNGETTDAEVSLVVFANNLEELDYAKSNEKPMN